MHKEVLERPIIAGRIQSKWWRWSSRTFSTEALVDDPLLCSPTLYIQLSYHADSSTHPDMNKSKMVQQAFTDFRTAILHQGGPAPAIGGVVKPFKPGGTDNHCPP
jgi:hypothetical protein